MNICLLTLYLKHFNESKLMFEGMLRKHFWFYFFFLRHSKINLWTSTYIFYKSTAPAKIKYVAFGTVLWKSAFCSRKIWSFCGLHQHIRSPRSLEFQVEVSETFGNLFFLWNQEYQSKTVWHFMVKSTKY